MEHARVPVAATVTALPLRRCRLAALLVMVAQLCACAGAPPYLESDIRPPRSVLVRVESGEAFTLPERFTQAPSAAGLALRNALLDQAAFPGGSCQGEFCAAIVLVDLAVRATIATVGAVKGVREAAALAEQANSHAQLLDAFRHAIAPLEVDTALALATRQALSGLRPDMPVVTGSATDPVGADGWGLTIRITQYTFDNDYAMGSRALQRYALVMTAVVSLDRAGKAVTAHNDYFHVHSGFHAFEEWAADDARLFRDEVNRAYRRLGEDIASELFAIYRDESAPGLARTPFARGFFMQPRYPEPVKLGLLNDPDRLAGGFGVLVTSDVQSLTPTLRWEPLPRRRSQGELPALQLPVPAQQLGYDLRLYDADRREIMRANNIAAPFYRISTPLAPCALYRWTVRARFPWEGRVRVTDWNGGYNGFETWNSNYPLPVLFGGRDNPGIYADRVLYYYRFRTPPEAGQSCPRA